MKRLMGCVVIAVAGLMASTAHSEISIKEYREMKDKDPETMKIYLNGVGLGLFWANLEFQDTLKKNVFCPPKKLAITAENYIHIADDEAKNLGYTSDFPIEFVLMRGLQKVFPCPRQKSANP